MLCTDNAGVVNDEELLMLLEEWLYDNTVNDDDWTNPHILWSRGDLRLVDHDQQVLTGAGRLEVRTCSANYVYMS